MSRRRGEALSCFNKHSYRVGSTILYHHVACQAFLFKKLKKTAEAYKKIDLNSFFGDAISTCAFKKINVINIAASVIKIIS
jgi:hypothetical protein